jgi:hypothetical protein
MQSLPEAPQFQVAPPLLGLLALLGVGLAFVAFVVVMSVLLASGVHVISSRRIKAIGALMLFVIPAIAVVAMIGMKWGAARAHTYSYYPRDVQTALETTDSRIDEQKIGAGAGSATVKPISKVDEATTQAAVIVEAEDTVDQPGRKTDRARSQFASVRAVDGANHKDGFPAASAAQTLVSASPLAGVLRVRGTASAPPDWAG